jgi:hypothetical protein
MRDLSSARALAIVVNPMPLWPYALPCVVFSAVVVACGSRTGLLVPGDDKGSGGPGPVGDDDSGSMVGHLDSGTIDDRSIEPPPIRDALPPLDVTAPGDAFNNCPDAGATFVYVVTEEFELMSFYPPTGEFKAIGQLSCSVKPNSSGPPFTPFSMAVDRSGVAYVLYNDGELFRVSTATASCRSTAFVSGQRGFADTFGMGFSRDTQATGETLFVASGGDNPSIATVNTTTFGLRVVGALNPPIDSAELTGTGAGDLFAFYSTRGANPCDNMDPNTTCTDSAIGQIDKTTGQVTNQSVLFGKPQGTAWAFAFWGGQFYTFTAPGSGTIVSRFDPNDGSVVVVAQRTDKIVGAGVSTCAPAQ